MGKNEQQEKKDNANTSKDFLFSPPLRKAGETNALSTNG